ncbi:MAG: GYD domain-containing protein [Anaerolineae bacterium]
MSKYLFTFNYSADASKGLLKEGGTRREKAGRQAVEAMGGTLEAFYFSVGPHDGYFICNGPDEKWAAHGLTLLRSNGFTATAVQLLSASDMDEAIKDTVDYTPPQG